MAKEFVLSENLIPIEYKQLRIANQAYAIGDAAMWDRVSDAIDVVPATSSTITANIAAISMETHLSTDTLGLFAILAPDQRWAADSTNASNTNHNQQRMVLTNQGTVNNTGTDSSAGIFQQTGTIGVASANRIVGRFLVGFSAN